MPKFSGTKKPSSRPSPLRWVSGSLSDIVNAGANNRIISGGHIGAIDFEISKFGVCVEIYDPGIISLMDLVLSQ